MAESNTHTVERDRPGGYPAPTGTGPANGTATTALVLGILSLVFAVLFFPLGIILGIVAIVLGAMGRGRARQGLATNGGAATAGLVTGVIGLLLGGLLAATIGLFMFNHKDTIKKCSQETTPQARQACVNQDLNRTNP
jgi:hypothetical protein